MDFGTFPITHVYIHIICIVFTMEPPLFFVDLLITIQPQSNNFNILVFVICNLKKRFCYCDRGPWNCVPKNQLFSVLVSLEYSFLQNQTIVNRNEYAVI